MTLPLLSTTILNFTRWQSLIATSVLGLFVDTTLAIILGFRLISKCKAGQIAACSLCCVSASDTALTRVDVAVRCRYPFLDHLVPVLTGKVNDGDDKNAQKFINYEEWMADPDEVRGDGTAFRQLSL